MLFWWRCLLTEQNWHYIFILRRGPTNIIIARMARMITTFYFCIWIDINQSSLPNVRNRLFVNNAKLLYLSVGGGVGISRPMSFLARELGAVISGTRSLLGGGHVREVSMSRGWVPPDMGPQEGWILPQNWDLGYHEIWSASGQYASYWNAV